MERREFVETTQVHFTSISKKKLCNIWHPANRLTKRVLTRFKGAPGGIPRIDGCYFNVVGLPLARVCRELADLGWSNKNSPSYRADTHSHSK